MTQDTLNGYDSNSMWSGLLGRTFNVAAFNARSQVYSRTYFTPGSTTGKIAATSWRQVPGQISVVMDAGAAPSVYRAAYSVRRDVTGALSTIRIPDPTTWKLQAKFAF